jgi:lysophospholipase L1-like esterase
MTAITTFVALGDSFTEGIGDPHPKSANGFRGWADLVALQLSQGNPAFRYANLGVRGRTMGDVIDNQISTALELKPDLTTVYAGMNDLLKVRTDLDAMMARYADALARLKTTGTRVVTFTAADIGTVPVFRRLRGRAAIYNELLRTIVDDLGIELVDFWRFNEFRDARMWDTDRIHPSALGHKQIAVRVLDVLGVSHTLQDFNGLNTDNWVPISRLRSDVYWAAAFAVPWVMRRLRRLTPGAGVEPKLASLTSVF